MINKTFLTEAKIREIILNKEKAIITNFTKEFNKIKRIDENEVLEIELLKEGWKNWVMGGLLTLSSIGGVYQFNKNAIEAENKKSELYNNIKPAVNKLTSEQKTDMLMTLQGRGSLNVISWVSRYEQNTYNNFMTQHPNATPEDIEKFLKTIEGVDSISDSISFEKVVSEHPEFFGLTKDGSLVLVNK